MHFFTSKNLIKFFSALIFIGGTFVFVQVDQSLFDQIVIGLFVLLSLIFTLTGQAVVCRFIVLNFLISYAFYHIIFTYNFSTPISMAMLIASFGIAFEVSGIFENTHFHGRSIFLVTYLLLLAEIFLALSYFLISPINQSIILTIMAYLFVGFCAVFIAKTEKNFFPYLFITIFSMLLILIYAPWG